MENRQLLWVYITFEFSIYFYTKNFCLSNTPVWKHTRFSILCLTHTQSMFHTVTNHHTETEEQASTSQGWQVCIKKKNSNSFPHYAKFVLGIDNVIVNHFSALSIYECFNKVKQYNKQKKKRKKKSRLRGILEKKISLCLESISVMATYIWQDSIQRDFLTQPCKHLSSQLSNMILTTIINACDKLEFTKLLIQYCNFYVLNELHINHSLYRTHIINLS